MYKGIDVVSSRSARLLGGNRTVSEPFEFVAGQRVSAASIRLNGDSAGGLFSGASGPKPPPALSTAVIGMKVGGKVSESLITAGTSANPGGQRAANVAGGTWPDKLTDDPLAEIGCSGR
jgi:hypothetical protein